MTCSSDGVASGSRVLGINLGGGIFAGNLATVAAPRISEGVLGIEVAGVTVAVMGSPTITSVGWTEQLAVGVTAGAPPQLNTNPVRRRTPLKDAVPQTVVRQGSDKIAVVVLRPNIVSFKQPESEPLLNGQIHAAAQDGSDTILRVESVYRHSVQADQSV